MSGCYCSSTLLNNSEPSRTCYHQQRAYSREFEGRDVAGAFLETLRQSTNFKVYAPRRRVRCEGAGITAGSRRRLRIRKEHDGTCCASLCMSFIQCSHRRQTCRFEVLRYQLCLGRSHRPRGQAASGLSIIRGTAAAESVPLNPEPTALSFLVNSIDLIGFLISVGFHRCDDGPALCGC